MQEADGAYRFGNLEALCWGLPNPPPMETVAMPRLCMMLALAALALAAASPAQAFWKRSQWLACSEAATPADYQRWRCWELDGYAGAIAPGYGGSGEWLPPPKTLRPSTRRGGTVSRLG